MSVYSKVKVKHQISTEKIKACFFFVLRKKYVAKTIREININEYVVEYQIVCVFVSVYIWSKSVALPKAVSISKVTLSQIKNAQSSKDIKTKVAYNILRRVVCILPFHLSSEMLFVYRKVVRGNEC